MQTAPPPPKQPAAASSRAFHRAHSAPAPPPGVRREASADMQKKAPTLGNIVVIVLFVLSCFGLVMFLWESFGGPLPLKPKGYRFSISFPRTITLEEHSDEIWMHVNVGHVIALAEQSDVRISGVNVGHVIALKRGADGRTRATVEVSGQYAPIRSDMH